MTRKINTGGSQPDCNINDEYKVRKVNNFFLPVGKEPGW
jgi:hypothetical protein